MESPLTPRQEEYFEILERIDPSPEMRRIIEDTKRDLREGDKVVRGFTRVKGFTPNDH
ncbi:hypothetical protein [Microbacterium rhizosphaerae]|uniref:Uncharacterized protein n=1 Tax=Microbacterium rhizosphaerae TaxID=1678237 RepID=A0ABZ0SL22_9MICO|nr:hypothetical protein [Microbacterium rhizosphaerae]WPR88397.1 hypothetical protein SM116_11470 [Microbacterium rhizosphaerae]